ncbi:MAG: glucose-6-phosphate isomerase [Nitrospirota bacterium]|jgi:glucose-6-phosphate isomerase
MIELDFGNMMSDVIGEHGLSERQVENLRPACAKAHGEIAERKWPGLAFMDLARQDTSEVKDVARDVRGHSENFLLLGIGGSALGPKTILEAMSPMHNLRRSPRVFIYDNVDPVTLTNVLSMVDLDKTTVCVVTKSGSTAETMASFMILYDKMRGTRGKIVAITDPQKGYLRQIAEKDKLAALPIPPDVGGRYSVLCPLGLVLAEVIGVDCDEILAGAARMQEKCSDPEPWKNPAYLYGAMLHIMDKEEKRNINVMVPYSDRLRPLAEWYCQLWSESLGKLGMGSTPYPSIGTTDQHSQMQLWMEGPQDKVVTFIRVEDHGAEITIPRVFKDTGVAYLGGHSMGELFNSEEEATELALAKAGRPNMRIKVPKVDAAHLGELFYFFEIAVAYAGFLYGINPFNQPSVEMSKNFTYGMMGREGYEGQRQEVEEARNRVTCWRL